MSVFVDTGLFYALQNTRAQHHEAAKSALAATNRGRYGRPFTNEYVFDEAVTLVRSHRDYREARVVGDRVLGEGEFPAAYDLLVVTEADFEAHETPPDAEHVAELEGIAETDAAVVLLASSLDDRLLANDRGLIAVARSNGVECDWVTTLLLRWASRGILSAEEAKDVLYDLVVAGMTLDPKVYVRVQRALDELG